MGLILLLLLLLSSLLSLPSRSRVLPEKPTGSQIVTKFPHFMEPEVSLHVSATCPNP
jgi:hypothetical protein